MKLIKQLSILVVLIFSINLPAQVKNIDHKVDSVLKLMTIDEKIGQMNQYTSDWNDATGPITRDGEKQNQIREGKVGSMLNVKGVYRTREIQSIAMQSRLRIPLIFGLDVIHGYRTTFPIPLAESCTWSPEIMERSARIAATEASASGIHWTFAPMVDIARDPRWGRIMEGAGEDTYLGMVSAIARVRGFQGVSADGKSNRLGDYDAIMACAKHFAAYGAAEGGRDYNSVDMSIRKLNETYLPPFKAAAEAGVATFMNSFNDINGIPATANIYIQRDLLKGKWQFGGFVVSDWGSIGEMIPHGFSKDNYEAAMQAVTAGSDMDMESRSYINNLKRLILEGKVDISIVDDAVRRILKKKFELGLFDDPYRFCNEEREQREYNNPENMAYAREVAKKSIVLLKNEGDLLPLKAGKQKIALIGPLVKAKTDNLGGWAVTWSDDKDRIVSFYEGVAAKLGGEDHILYAEGCKIKGDDKSGFKEALKVASRADIIVMSVGESGDMAGEAKSRSNLQLPGVQEELIKTMMATGKPVVVLISAGRPLIFNWTADNVPAILYTWWLGHQAGNAIADVLFGDYNPSGKLTVTFPRSEGQIPIYYNHFNTGRPVTNDGDHVFKSAYSDLTIYPKYPFGFGLSYSKFEYSDLKLSKSELFGDGDVLDVSVIVKNIGKFEGEETVQLYLRDLVGKVVRPVSELKSFKKVVLKPGESEKISFRLTAGDLKFYDNELRYDWESGDFIVMAGGNSRDVLSAGFNWKKENWKLIWSDEFNYKGLPDQTKWSYDTAGNADGWGNNEAQFYTAECAENAFVDHGILTITALKKQTGGKEYTSARLVTKGKGDWLYGRVEVRAKIPASRGTWPAIWMLPTDWEYGGWPASGEIDIMENVGYDKDIIVGSAHTKRYNHVIGTQKNNRIFCPDSYKDFQVYALEWDEKEYRLYVNDNLYFTFKKEAGGSEVWPFDKRFHLILNLAIGGNWGGLKGIDDSAFPNKFEIDYVRVYQKVG